jgi:hypothetical protein
VPFPDHILLDARSSPLTTRECGRRREVHHSNGRGAPFARKALLMCDGLGPAMTSKRRWQSAPSGVLYTIQMPWPRSIRRPDDSWRGRYGAGRCSLWCSAGGTAHLQRQRLSSLPTSCMYSLLYSQQCSIKARWTRNELHLPIIQHYRDSWH